MAFWGPAAFLLYMLSFGPIAAITFRNRSPSMGEPAWAFAPFKPVLAALHMMPAPMRRAYTGYLESWILALQSKADRRVYEKIKLGMTQSQVEKLVGLPAFRCGERYITEEFPRSALWNRPQRQGRWLFDMTPITWSKQRRFIF